MKQPVEKQVQLPLSRALEIAWRSLRVRMGRSALTLLTIVMAIAFLSNVWTTRALAGAASVEGGAPTAGGAARTVWLLSLSLLVCLVGISNAMLMSVMERFREIGTMKCLGAVDSFILRVFFLESLMLGATGSVVGTALGEIMTLLFSGVKFGSQSGGWVMPWGTLGEIGAASIAIGLFITAAAALYPAWKAARMEPIAAMRVEV